MRPHLHKSQLIAFYVVLLSSKEMFVYNTYLTLNLLAPTTVGARINP